MIKNLEKYFDRLWPINRSITGPGFRESLDILSEIIPMERMFFKTGQKVFDWVVPKEWTIRDAYFIDPKGKKHAEFSKNNLHIMGYSTLFKGTISFDEFKKHIYTIPHMPEAIPYVTSYYNEKWGFCISQNEFDTLSDGEYQVYIDSDLFDGTLEIGEAVIPGNTDKEILFSTYLCHPSLANNELSGPLVMAFLYQRLVKMHSRKYTYRFVMLPETIGSICYLSKRGKHLSKYLIAGYIMSCLGDTGNFTYKKSRQENSLGDKAAQIVLKSTKNKYSIISFNPADGSDERQFCSPGFNLPVGSLMRTIYGMYPEYHTSLDNKDIISFKALEESVEIYYLIVKALEWNKKLISNIQYCEPHLGSRGLYPSVTNSYTWKDDFSAIKWILNYSDGKNDLFNIAEKSGCRIDTLLKAAQKLLNADLIKEVA